MLIQGAPAIEFFKKRQPIRNMSKEYDWQYKENEIRMANKTLNISPDSLVDRELRVHTNVITFSPTIHTGKNWKASEAHSVLMKAERKQTI